MLEHRPTIRRHALAIATIAQAALACGCITTLIVGLVFGLVAMVAASAAVLVQINHMN